MKVYKIEVMVIDFDGLGANELVQNIENVNYPNDCLSPNVMNIIEVDIGEWEDNNPLNNKRTQLFEYNRLFTTPKS